MYKRSTNGKFTNSISFVKFAFHNSVRLCGRRGTLTKLGTLEVVE